MTCLDFTMEGKILVLIGILTDTLPRYVNQIVMFILNSVSGKFEQIFVNLQAAFRF
jgi:hypothetical protein